MENVSIWGDFFVLVLSMSTNVDAGWCTGENIDPPKFFFLGRHELTYFKITLPKCWFTENYYRSIFFFQQGFILKIKICYIFVLFLRVVCYWLKTSRPLDSLYLENLQYVNNGTFYWFLICLWSLGWNYCMAQPNIGYWKFFILCTFFSSGNILCIHMII